MKIKKKYEPVITGNDFDDEGSKILATIMNNSAKWEKPRHQTSEISPLPNSEVNMKNPVYTVMIGKRGATVHVENNFSHPLTFGFEYPEYDKKLNKQGIAIAKLIQSAPSLKDLLKETNEKLAQAEKDLFDMTAKYRRLRMSQK
tara:strand:- start:1142 stop:1573 length:432 start_codon:yes stop_codon:yes gene_type:complete